MSYQRERDEFISRMTCEGLNLDVTRRLLRAATTMQRYAELACSSEAADQDRVHCPYIRTRNADDCCCDGDMSKEFTDSAWHSDIPRITVLDQRLKRRTRTAVPIDWAIHTQGDPRGYVLRVVPPSYAERNKGKDRHNLDTIGVPSGPTGLRF